MPDIPKIIEDAIDAYLDDEDLINAPVPTLGAFVIAYLWTHGVVVDAWDVHDD